MTSPQISGRARPEGGALSARIVVPSIRQALAVVLGMTVACAALAVLAVPASAGLGVVGSFGNGAGTGDGQLLAPKRMAVHDATGNVFVVDQGNDRVQVFAPDGDGAVYLTQFGLTTLDDPLGIAIDQDTGEVYVSDDGGIARFDSDGQPTPAFTVDSGFAAPGVTGPLGFDQAADQLVVADTADDTVKRYTTTGATAGTSFDGSSSSGGAFTGLLDIAVASDGDVVVVDSPSGSVDDLVSSGQSRVERFTTAGAHELTYGPVLGGAGALAIDADNGQVLVAGNFQSYFNNGNLTIDVFAADGTGLHTFELPGHTLWSTVRAIAAQGDGSSRAYTVTDQQHGFGSVGGLVLDEVDPPAATIAPATDVAEFSATAHGNVDPGGAPATYRFEYSVQGTGEWTPAGDQGSVDIQGDVQAQLTGLADGTAYEVRLVATNPGGGVTTPTVSFTTLDADPPTVADLTVSDLDEDSAHLAGTVNPQGHPTTAYFEYSTDGGASWAATPGQDMGSSTSPQSIDEDLQLEPSSEYQVRLVATNGAGTATTDPETFATDPIPPTVVTLPPGPTTASTAVTGGTVNPHNSSTAYWIEYGTTTGYGSSIPATQDAAAGDGDQPTDVSYLLTGLQADTLYHYRVVAQNEGGTTHGPDQTAKTLSTNAPELPHGQRALELVTPSENASDVGMALRFLGDAAGINATNGTSPDGNTVAYWAWHPIGDNAQGGLVASYRSHRTDAGWESSQWTPSLPIPGVFMDWAFMQDVTPDLSAGLMLTRMPFGELDVDDAFDVYAVRDDAPTEWVTSRPQEPGFSEGNPSVSIETLSDDGAHAFFSTEKRLTPVAEGQISGPSLYERTAGVTRLVNVATDGTLLGSCGAMLGTPFGGPNVNKVSRDGDRVFFSATECDGPPGTWNLYMRENGQTTTSLGSWEGGNTAPFVGASEDGSRVLFLSTDLLTDDAPPIDGPGEADRRHLYRYDVSTGDYELVAPYVGGVAGVSNDGETVYWVASAPGGDGRALYTRAGAGPTRLIAIPGPESYLEMDGWMTPEGLSGFKISRDGDRAVFLTSARLTSSVTAGKQQLYVFDADDDRVHCASCPPDGSPPVGDATLGGDTTASTAPDAEPMRNLPGDGRTLVFDTSHPLVPRDTNGRYDVYEWRAGRPHLVTDGRSSSHFSLFGVSESGEDVFFMTRNSILSTDRDNGAYDVYDARVGGGFAEPTSPAPCRGEQCQGEPGAEPDLAGGSTDLAGGGSPERIRASLRVGSISAGARERLVRTGRLSIRVRSGRAGRVIATLRARIHGRRLTVARTSRVVEAGRPVAVTLRLSRVTRRRLASRARTSLQLTVSMPGVRKHTRFTLIRKGR